MRTTLRLYAADLRYPSDLRVYTAASGPIASLSERYLTVERSDGFSGAGEVRANITYLSGLPEEAVDGAIRDLCIRLAWSAEPEEILARIDALRHEAPHIACAAVESALIEGMARRSGVPVARWLGGEWHSAISTNQCLFWSSDDIFDRLTDRFLAEGFKQLKVRVAVGPFERDRARLERLRDRAGQSVSIAIDANGAWSADEAIERLRALEPLGLTYVEQPTAPRDWAAFRKVLDNTLTPLMADEGVAGEDDLEELCAIGSRALAHLKIVKLGGPLAVCSAAKRLTDAGVGVMIGQMNEGALATAMTAHCAMALAPRYAELYGCYGLLDDVTPGVSYSGGEIRTPSGAGLGTMCDPAKCRAIWVEEIS